MENLLLSTPEYKVDRTGFGTWKRFLYASGRSFTEFTSHRRILGWPLVHYTSGTCPQTGRIRVAKGVIAVGRVAVGVCAVGQVSAGVIAIGQAGLGILAGLGQLTCGLLAVGQVGIGAFCLAQMAIGAVAICQMGAGWYLLAQEGIGTHVWDMKHADPVARAFFRQLFLLF